jgi:hypothetical protein
MATNYEIQNTKDVYLKLKSDRLKVIEKSVLNFSTGESVLAYKCQIGDKKEWIHHTVVEAFFEVIGDYDGTKTKRKAT